MPTSAKRTPRPRAAEPAAPDILHALGDEHKYQARLLNLLEKQVGLLNQKLPADLEVMAGVMRYMTRYPDRFHHPKEDLLFEKIVLRDAAAKPRVDELLQAHETIIGQGAELLRALGITDPRRLDIDRLWAQRRGRADPLRRRVTGDQFRVPALEFLEFGEKPVVFLVGDLRVVLLVIEDDVMVQDFTQFGDPTGVVG